MERYGAIESVLRAEIVELEAALDAEREKVKELECYRALWKRRDDELTGVLAQLATLQAQLRQVEHDAETYRKMHTVCTMNLALANNELTTLRQLVSALPIGYAVNVELDVEQKGGGDGTV